MGALSFKDALGKEAEAVFLNPSEFGNLMIIDGAEMPAAWGEESRPAPDVHGTSVDAWGLNTETAILHIGESRIALPVPGQEITVDGVCWTVTKARPSHGLLRLELERNTA